MVPIRSELSQNVEPPWFRPTVERLVSWLPEAYCRNLGAVVLTETAVIRKRRVRRSRASRRGVTLGRYHRPWNGEPAWIELVVDEVVKGIPGPLCWIRAIREFAVGRVLFHEIGHHLDATIGSVGRTGEHGAIAWEKRLSGEYLRKRHGYLRPFGRQLMLVARFAKWMAARKRKRAARS